MPFLRISCLLIFSAFFMPPGVLFSQTLQGYYTGQLKLASRNLIMAIQLDLMEEDGKYGAVFRSRYAEDREITGCDNWLQGSIEKQTLVMNSLVSIKETKVPAGTCNIFKTLRLNLKPQSADSVFSGTILDGTGDIFGKITLKRVDRENSFSVMDEKQEAFRLIAERTIASTFDDSTRIDLMVATRGADWIDTLTIGGSKASLMITAPEADLYHKLTILLNGNPVAINKSPKQQGINIKLNDLEPGDLELLLLCYHAMVEVTYNVTLTLQWDGGQKTWIIPVSTFRNRGIVLRVPEVQK